MAQSTAEALSEDVVELTEEAPIHVLHVDDDAGFLRSAKQILELQGAFQVKAASSVEEALETMKDEAFDAIVSDYVMPGRDGLDFLEELREGGNNIPFIIFTGKGREEVAIEALNLGADRYLNKIGKPETVYPELAHGIRGAVRERRAARRIWRREQRLSAIFASSPDAITVSDLQGNITDCNEAAWKMSGYSSKEELLGKSAFELIAEKDRKRALENLEKTLEQGTTRNLEYTLLGKNGDEYIGELSASLIKEPSGSPTGFVAVIRNITQRKKAEKERQKLLHNLQERGKELHCLHETSKLLENPDLPLEEALKRTVNLLPPAWQYPDITSAKIALEGREFKTKNFKETRWKQQASIKVHGGRAGTVEVCYSEEKPTFDEGPFLKEERNLIDGIADRLGRTIERKRAEQSLRASEERWRSLVNNTNDYIILVDDKSKVEYINKAMPPHEPEQIVGRSIYDYSLKDYHNAMKEDLENVFKTGRPGSHQSALSHPLGIRWFRTKTVPIRDEGKISKAILICEDITELKKREEELRESEEKYRNIIERAPLGILTFDLKGKVTSCNTAIPRLSGYSKHEIVGKHFTRLPTTKLKDAPEYLRIFKDIIRGKTPEPFEFEYTHKDGTTHFGEIHFGLMKRRGKTIGFQAIMREISEHKKTREEVKKSEERYRRLMEETPVAILNLNMKGEITYVNKRYEEITGYSRDEILGGSWTDMVRSQGMLPEKTMKLAAERVKDRLEGMTTGPMRLHLRRKDGGWIWIEGESRMIKKSGVPIGLQASFRDVTKRMEAEEALKESREKFQHLFKANPEAAVYVDSTFHILDVNPRFEELFGYSLNEVKDEHIDDVIVPRDKIEEAEMLDKKAGEGYVYHDTVRRQKDGTLVSVSISAAPIRTEDQLIGCVALYRDITRRKRAEEALKESLHNLETLTEKLDVVGRITRHDVRNKLNAIYSEAYLAKMKLPGNREALEHLSGIESAVEQAARIFDFARTYEQIGIEEPIPMDVEKTFQEAVKQFSDLQAEVINDCQGLTVLADSLLRQLFYNLIHNSLRHGEKVSQIRVSYEADKDKAKLVYEDNGVGIPKAEKEKIFNEGYGKGTGYGLYLTKKITEVYGWTIKETGKKGKGAQFTITIPKTERNGRTSYKLQ